MKNQTPLIWNPFHKEYKENPHEQLRLLREHHPVHKGINGRWMILKYQDLKLLLTDPVFKTVDFSRELAAKSKFLPASENFDQIAAVSAKWFLFFDPPQHTEIRSWVAKIWNTINLQDAIKTITEESLERITGEKEIDIIRDFAVFIPSRVVCKILGLPVEDYAKFKIWSYHFNSLFEPFATLYDLLHYNQSAQEFYDYMNNILAAKKQEPDDAFIGKLLVVNETLGKPLNNSELISIIAFMFFAGIETSVNLFGQSVLQLIRNPEQARILRENDSMITNAVEELLRFVSPNQYTTRIAAEDFEIGGKLIKAGEYLMGATVSANRDPEVFVHPEELDFTRKTNPHLSFGFGSHYCLGARVAREEISVSIPALFRRFPQIALNPEKNYEWDKIILNRGLRSLPVVLHP